MAIHGKKKHEIHPHILQLEYVKEAYDCNYCKEVDFGKRYSCPEKECDWHMHDVCVDLPRQISHRLLGNRVFDLRFINPGKTPKWDCFCTACAREISYSMYMSSATSSRSEAYLHPCCALTLEDKISNGHVNLLLQMELSSDCHFCGLQELSNGRKSWGYVSRDDKESHQFHLFCVKKKLVENWEMIMLGVDRNGDPIGEGEDNDCHHELTALLFSNIDIPAEQSDQKLNIPDLSHLLSDQKANIPRIRRQMLE